jgi:predicted Ser/Thr protein kinase
VPYPSLEQYQEALQSPRLALTDTQLARGTVRTTGLGLPLAMCGGFALTYTVTVPGKKYAVRCFHRQSNGLEARYAGISAKLRSLGSPYFVDFEFEPRGVRVNGSLYPIVKMAWANGDTLGEFVEDAFRSKQKTQALTNSLAKLAQFIEGCGIAHGDIQPGNVMVTNDGGQIQVIDYDGMFVPSIATLGSAELGHRNFQHPRRSQKDFNSRLDRFSFIALNVALRALTEDASLWNATQSEAEAIVFRASDFADPSSSAIFSTLFGKPALSRDARALAGICTVGLDKVPTLDDFLANRNCPQFTVQMRVREDNAPGGQQPQYLGQYPVLDASDYSAFAPNVGQVVELIGLVVDVHKGVTRRGGRPYLFVNFGYWKGNAVKLNIWSDTLTKMQQQPSRAWVGQWVSATGLVEPPYQSRKYSYSHIGITISSPHQVKTISEAEAKRRLGTSGASVGGRLSNVAKLGRKVRTQAPPSRAPGRSVTSAPPSSRNQGIVRQMQSASAGSRPQGSTGQRPSQSGAARTSQHWLRRVPWWAWVGVGWLALYLLSKL